jgi:flagellar hook-length control protein FliK
VSIQGVAGRRAGGELESDLAPGSDPFADSASDLEALESPPNPSSLLPPQQLATLTPAAAVDAPKPPPPASDPALVRQVAQQVLAGIEIHMTAGRTQVDLGLDLGSLGQAQVELSKLPNEGVKLVFRIETADAQQAVARNLPDLVQALEQKGMVPQIDLRRGDGSPLGGGQHERQAAQQQAGQQQNQGRSRGEYVPVVEEER